MTVSKLKTMHTILITGGPGAGKTHLVRSISSKSFHLDDYGRRFRQTWIVDVDALMHDIDEWRRDSDGTYDADEILVEGICDNFLQVIEALSALQLSVCLLWHRKRSDVKVMDNRNYDPEPDVNLQSAIMRAINSFLIVHNVGAENVREIGRPGDVAVIYRNFSEFINQNENYEEVWA